MKKRYLFTLSFLLSCSIAMAQEHKEKIEKSVERKEAISHFRYLASDEMKGRDPMRPEIDLAARYIAEQFWRYGAQEVEGADGFYQFVPFRVSGPPSKGELKIGDQTYEQGTDILVLDGSDLSGSYSLVAAGHGLEDDYSNLDVDGKIVVVKVGAPDQMSPSELMALGRKKKALAKEHGAAGLIEMFNAPTAPWGMLTNYLNRTQMTVDESQDEASLPYIWLKDLSGEHYASVNQGNKSEAEITIEGKINRKIQGRNVVAVIEGTDPELKNEYIMLSAHYDHIGVGQPNAEGDSIYNGARDNAVGTVAVINAAKYFAENPPKRSVLLCAWTAEEKGLLGSAYFADNPLVPLDNIVFNMNIDNGGYNDTSLITVIGLGRTTADPLIEDAVRAFDLKPTPDPSPEQGLYDRSDNVNFARKGIPSPTYSLGFTAFDDEIGKYYHQQADRVDNFDLDYAMLYWKSYLLSAQKVADMDERPFWLPGDKYEEAGRELYGMEAVNEGN
ncbi:M28 family peptidase [Litoribacter ruber]|uniref:M28 family peptidase n=1 Tax=Litoribacter ruber TaxID=702568 RepID=UPI001BDAB3AF|nr:M28 family peptidase [Litoribacter ruber]MBT0810205.1 M28 family peptidase [Litoribacter ruber]